MEAGLSCTRKNDLLNDTGKFKLKVQPKLWISRTKLGEIPKFKLYAKKSKDRVGQEDNSWTRIELRFWTFFGSPLGLNASSKLLFRIYTTVVFIDLYCYIKTS